MNPNLSISNLFDVSHKIVLVTGGSRGIGLMIASGFVANNATVYITARSMDQCTKVAKSLSDQGPGKCIAVVGDLQSKSDLDTLVTTISQHHGKLHVLVNNAGTNWNAPLESYPDSAFEKVLTLNVRRGFNLVQLCLPLLLNAATVEDPARIINIGSIYGENVPLVETYAYSASKAALHHLTRVLAGHLSTRGPITVNAIAPGPFPTKMMQATLDKFEHDIVSRIPLNRLGRPSDIAGLCIYLSSQAGMYQTGTVVPLDGGALVRANL